MEGGRKRWRRERKTLVGGSGRKGRVGILHCDMILFWWWRNQLLFDLLAKPHFISLTAFRIREYCSEFLKGKVHRFCAE